MTELSIFDFEGQEIRVCGSTEQPEWVAADVGAVLGLEHTTLSRRVPKLPETWKGVYSIHTLGGQQQMLTVTEPGLYELIFRSDKPAAQRFRIWMFEEVLPSIRRTGSYSHAAPEQGIDAQVSQLIELAQTQVEVINEQQKMLAAALATLSKTKAKDKKQPKWTPRSTSHLMEFVREVGLEYQPDSRIDLIDLWQWLRDWYVKTGVLKIELVKGKEKLTWRELQNKRDCPVKAINQVYRFGKLSKTDTWQDLLKAHGINGDSYLATINDCSTHDAVDICVNSAVDSPKPINFLDWIDFSQLVALTFASVGLFVLLTSVWPHNPLKFLPSPIRITIQIGQK